MPNFQKQNVKSLQKYSNIFMHPLIEDHRDIDKQMEEIKELNMEKMEE